MRILDGLLDLVHGGLSASVRDYIDLESMDDTETLTTSAGGMVSVIHLSGGLGMVSAAGLGDLAEGLRLAMAPFLESPGHAVEFYFSQDPGCGAALVRREVDRAAAAARIIGLDIEDLLDDRVARLSGVVVEERVLLAVHTSPDILDRDSRRHGEAERSARLGRGPQARSAQVPDRALDAVWKRHRSFVEALVTDIGKRNALARLLPVREALQEIRAVLRPETSADAASWHPRLPAWHLGREDGAPGIMMPDRPEELSGRDVSNLLPADFATQLADADAIEIDPGVIQIGDVLIAGFDLTLVQEQLTAFDGLIDRIARSSIRFPWRVSMLIEPGGRQAVALKLQFSRVFSWASHANRRIIDACDALRDIDGQTDTVVRYRTTFAVWGPIGDPHRFRAMAATMRSLVQQWGSCHVDGLSGDALATVLSSVPGASRRSTAPVVAAPLGGVLVTAPISRQASPWSSGASLFRTEDGKLWPYQPGSARQITWNDLYVGPPGSGKSVMLNSLNLSLLLSPGSVDATLPRVRIIDIGQTSAGLIDLVRAGLPAARRGEVVFRRLRGDAGSAINPLDTQLGMRRPLASERIFLLNFFAVLFADTGQTPPGPPPAPMIGLISAALDAAYARKADGSEPERYEAGVSPAVDRVLGEEMVTVHPEMTWWEVVDALAERERWHEASLAQRHAVPLISDLSSVTGEENIRRLYTDALDPTAGQGIIDSFHRVLAEVTREFPILSRPTRFGIAGASVVSLDLQDVTASGASAARRTSLMYMLARHLLTRDFFLDEEEIRNAIAERAMPQLYEARHRAAARAARATPKRLCIDEWHRTGSVPGLVDQMVQDMREGRKHGVQIGLASQFLSDFEPSMIEAASSVFIHSGGGEPGIEALNQAFTLSDVEARVVRRELNGPTARGAPFMLISRIREGTVRQKLWLTLGAIEIWALSTTAEDVMLRRLLYERLGASRARALLAARFPTGSSVPEIETRKARYEEGGGRLDEAVEQGMIETLAREIEDLALRSMGQARPQHLP